MKAVVFQPAALSFAIEERPIPTIGPNEVLIRLQAAALNRRDYSMMLYEPNRQANPFIFGADGAGVIEAVGENVIGWQVGDEVITNPAFPCGDCEYCLAGQHASCPQFRTLGSGSHNGTFAEYIKLPASNVARKPEHLDAQQAAALPLALGTAWRALITRASLKAGETLLIHGIGGGVALYALQIAVNMGVRVIVTSGSEAKLQKAKELGAAVGINYKTEDVLQRVLDETAGKGVDVVLDGVGKDTLAISVEVAKQQGRVVYFGNNREWDEDKPMIWPSPIWFKQLSFLGTGMFGPTEFAQALQFVNYTRLVPVVSEVLPLDEVGTAFDRLKNHQQFGKLVLSI